MHADHQSGEQKINGKQSDNDAAERAPRVDKENENKQEALERPDRPPLYMGSKAASAKILSLAISDDKEPEIK